MILIEMSRDVVHGGGTWAFPNCVWAPTRKKNGARWPFWEKVAAIREGDVVLHLLGVSPNAHFVGFSLVAADGFETSKRPPDPGEWGFAKFFYRANLVGFTPFHKPIRLSEVLLARRLELEEYFEMNAAAGVSKKNILLVKQSGQLQCLNGAYLSEVDDALFSILFGNVIPSNQVREKSSVTSVETGWQLSTIQARQGQSEFAWRLKELYGYKCCFPSCEVSDRRFLVASHIARWSDNKGLRGELGNGLCFCVMHDKAFELGLFTLDERYQVYANPRENPEASSVTQEIYKAQGVQISLASVHPLEDALMEHWHGLA